MDVLLLGAAAIVLLALTIWIVWRPGADEGAVRTQEGPHMMPQGDRFEDQYTSATADLSAGGVAISNAIADEADTPEVAAVPSTTPTLRPTAGSQWPEATLEPPGATFSTYQRDAVQHGPPVRTVSIGAAALLTLGGAITGAWLYARWQRERNKPINRLRRRLG